MRDSIQLNPNDTKMALFSPERQYCQYWEVATGGGGGGNDKQLLDP